jgi:glutamate/tyrosine decarboxylase-like PLP-dependent enzyme
MSIDASYLAPGELREPAHYGPEMSRRARGVALWAALRSLGRSGMAELIDRTCGHAQTFAGRLRGLGYEILNDVVINQVLVSFGPPATTRRIIERLRQDGVCWCGATEFQGRTAMRISVSSWATTSEDVETAIAGIHRIARECLQEI